MLRLSAPLLKPLLAFASLSALGACATMGGATATQSNLSPADRDARAAIGREDTLSQMTFWADQYTRNPQDLEASQRFAETLRVGGRADRAAQIAQESLQRHANDPALMRTLGLSLIATGRANDALRPLALLAQADAQDWRARSSLGIALDDVGRNAEARRAYQEALAIQPNDPGVLTNLGVSHILTGDAAEAERVLRMAIDQPNAPPEARQNLALALGLQGRFDEAERLQRVDLPPALVAQNMAFIRGLFSDPRRWQDMRQTRTN
ncbi:MAG: tetratricopeptide repeat protein [Hyphomonadaceae bacterium]